MSDRRDPTDHLPLRPVDFHILLVLTGEELHGYGLVKKIAAASEGRIALQPGNLYRYVRRLEDDGLIAPGERREADGSGAERRRYYRITPFGRRVLEAEASRMRELAAQVDRVAPGSGSGLR